MSDHRVQKTILQKLVESQSARFAELRPKNVEGNIFTYHLKALVKRKLIQKNSDGSYSLTAEGKLVGINNAVSRSDKLSQAHATILIAVEKDGAWLLRKRLVQPMFGKIGFIHGEPKAGESVIEAAGRILQYRTDLTADFVVRGSGFVTLTKNSHTESFTSFTLLSAYNLKGDLRPKDPHGENFWLKNPDFNVADMIPSMPELTKLVSGNKNQLFFIELKF